MLQAQITASAGLRIIFADHFNGPNGTDLVNHFPDITPTGLKWTGQQGGMVLDGNGNAVYSTGQPAIYTNNMGVADGTIEAMLTPQNTLDGYGFIVRYVDNSNFTLLEVNSGPANNNNGLWEKIGGTFFQRIQLTLSLVAGTAYPVSIQMQGATITIAINGNQGVYYNAVNLTSTVHGISSRFANEMFASLVLTQP